MVRTVLPVGQAYHQYPSISIPNFKIMKGERCNARSLRFHLNCFMPRMPLGTGAPSWCSYFAAFAFHATNSWSASISDVFGQRDESLALGVQSHEAPEMHDAVLHNDVAAAEVGPPLLPQAIEQLDADGAVGFALGLGSLPVRNTIGMVVVAALAACTPAVPPPTTRTDTGWMRSLLASAGNRS
jgi:hypothetical protein